MTSTLTRLAVLAAFGLAVLSGPAMALCSGGSETGCCCTKDRKCPRPMTPEARSVSCCKSSQPAPPPPSGTSDRGLSLSMELAYAETPPATADEQRRAFARSVDTAAEKNVSGIGLYTLHAAFLI